MTDLHLIYTVYEGFVSVESPQIPELVGGRNTADEMLADLPSILELAGVYRNDYARVFAHEQKHIISPGGNEFLLRVCIEGSTPESQKVRMEGAGRLLASIEKGLEDQPDQIERIPQLSTTERLLISVAGTDSLGWCLAQLGPADSAVVQWNRSGDAMWGLPIVSSDLSWNGSDSIENLGLSESSTVEECFDAVLAGEVAGVKDSLLVLPAP